MPAVSQKNQVLSFAAQDLGLGDQLQSQVEDQVLQRKKKLAALDQPASLGMSPSVMSLFGQGGFNV
jgi:hypothetical protein